MVDTRKMSEAKSVQKELAEAQSKDKSPEREKPAGSESGTPSTLGSFVFGDMPKEAREVIREEERSFKTWFINTISTIVKFLGIDRLLSYIGFPMLGIGHQNKSSEEETSEDHPNKRKHNELELEDEADESINGVEKEAKKWRPDSAYVSIQLFIRKMFGAPDPNGNLDRDSNSEDRNMPSEDQLIEDGAGRNWNLEPDCQFVSKEENDTIPFSSPPKCSSAEKKIHDENLNKFESQSPIQNGE